MTPLAALAGAAFGFGVLLLVLTVSGRAPRGTPARATAWLRTGDAGLRVSLGVGAALLAGALTRWPVGAMLAGAGAFAAPRLLGARAEHRARTARTEAVAVWAEMLRDSLAAAAGLEQAIATTAPVAPPPIRGQVVGLAHRIESGTPLSAALRAFADDLGDPTGDLVSAALIVSAERRGGQLTELLGALAEVAREQTYLQLEIEAGRARTYTAVRVVAGTTLAMAVGLLVLNRSYLDPYETATGQAVLALVGLIFAAALAWLARMARVATPTRLLSPAGSGREAGS